MDSGANHLIDISFDQQFQGLCGFTLEDFDSLFADRMESTLSHLKDIGEMPLSSNLEDLRAKLQQWYGGYNWCKEARVFNPYSLLHFFNNHCFRNYWNQMRFPNSLTEVIRARPVKYLDIDIHHFHLPDLLSRELSSLSSGGVLFFSGYLTVDKREIISENDPFFEHMLTYYSFKFPNLEIASSYYKDCLSLILDISRNEFECIGEKLQMAFLARQSQVVTDMFNDFLSALAKNQSLDYTYGKTIRHFIYLMLTNMGFKLQSEHWGSDKRLNLCLELEQKTFILMEFKCCPNTVKIPEKLTDKIVADIARKRFPAKVVEECLADAVKSKLKVDELIDMLYKRDKMPTTAEANKILAQHAEKVLSPAKINRALRLSYQRSCNYDGISTDLEKMVLEHKSIKEQFDQILSQTAGEALHDLKQNDRQGIVPKNAQEVIELGLAIYQNGTKIKAVFSDK
jgi:hypothetical protein